MTSQNPELEIDNILKEVQQAGLDNVQEIITDIEDLIAKRNDLSQEVSRKRTTGKSTTELYLFSWNNGETCDAAEGRSNFLEKFEATLLSFNDPVAISNYSGDNGYRPVDQRLMKNLLDQIRVHNKPFSDRSWPAPWYW